MPARWSLRLLGGFELGGLPGGESVAPPGKRERVLLAYLALSPNGRQPRRKLATLLWGDADRRDHARQSAHLPSGTCARRLAIQSIASLPPKAKTLCSTCHAFDVDVLAFRRLAAQSGRTELEAAATLYSGEFLDGLVIESEEFESWRRAEAARSRDQADRCSHPADDAIGARAARPSARSRRAMRILRLEPLHEGAVRRLMRLYGESGRRGAAIQLYRTFADALRTELDAATRGRDARCLRGDRSRRRERQATDRRGCQLPPRPRAWRAQAMRPAGPLRPPARPAFRLRAPLAVLAGVLLVATALISYRQFAPLGTPEGVVAERAAAADPASAISIAVLPFLNLSGDASQEFFSDGMTEEITSALAMVPDLKVVARTSAFQFKGEKNDMRAVGQALNATHLVEGSVRKEGDRVRITAQLIEAGNGTHLWSENYDRQLSDIFATQEEIARTIVGSLMAPLGLAPGERLVSNRTHRPGVLRAISAGGRRYAGAPIPRRSSYAWNCCRARIRSLHRAGRCSPAPTEKLRRIRRWRSGDFKLAALLTGQERKPPPQGHSARCQLRRWIFRTSRRASQPRKLGGGRGPLQAGARP